MKKKHKRASYPAYKHLSDKAGRPQFTLAPKLTSLKDKLTDRSKPT